MPFISRPNKIVSLTDPPVEKPKRFLHRSDSFTLDFRPESKWSNHLIKYRFVMKKFQLSFLFLIAFSRMINAQVSHLVISQVYSAGGNSGAAYNRDYVELFNPTGNAVSLTGHSIQYSTATGSTWTSRALSGNIAAHSYFLIQMTTSGTNGSPLPTPAVRRCSRPW